MTSVPRRGFSIGSTVNSPWPSDSQRTPSVGLAGHAREDRHLVGDHERGVEADAELADQLGPLRRLGCFKLFEERRGAGLGDGAEVLDGALAVHADAVVGDGQRAGVLVDGDLDLPVLVAFEQVLVLTASRT